MKHKSESGKSNPEFGLDKSGIAGYPKAPDSENEKTDEKDKADEGMEVDKPKEAEGNDSYKRLEKYLKNNF